MSGHGAPVPMTSRKCAMLKGVANVPGDKSISHRSLILGGLAVGRTTVSGLLEGEDVLATAAAMRALGATVKRHEDGTWEIHGRGIGTLDERRDGCDVELDVERSGCHDRVKRTAVRDIARHLTEVRDIDRQVEHGGERRDAREAHLADAPIGHVDADVDAAARGLEQHRHLGGLPWRRVGYGDDALLDGVATERDRRMTAHRAEALVVEEEDREVRAGQIRLDRPDAVHVGMATRLRHERAPQMVEMRLRGAALLEDGRTRDRGQPVDDDPDRLTSGMELDGADRHSVLPTCSWVRSARG